MAQKIRLFLVTRTNMHMNVLTYCPHRGRELITTHLDILPRTFYHDSHEL